MAKAKKIEIVSTGYRPRKLQAILHASLKRYNVLVCHRRFGKTVFSINEMVDQGLSNSLHNPQYAYVAPTYKQAKMIAWEYIQDYTREIPGYEANKSELTVTIHRQGVRENGRWTKKPDKIKFMLLGADNPDALRGIYLDGGIIDEYAQCDPTLWGEVIRPTLTDRLGWIIFIGTPKGQNHFYHRLNKAKSNKGWFTAVYKASETGIIPNEELEEMKLDMDDAEYEQELECSFTAAVRGSYYGSIINDMKKTGMIGDFPYDPTYPVDTFWDLGIGDSLSIWFRQKLPGEKYRYVDYFEESGNNLEEVARMMKEKEYSYGRHIIPWDGRTRDIGTGLTRQETLRNHGIITEIQKRQGVDDRIQAARLLLRKCYFHESKCAKGVEALASYQKEWDSKAMHFKKNPKHDWASHAADAFGYSALDKRDSRFADGLHKDLPRQADQEYDELGGGFL